MSLLLCLFMTARDAVVSDMRSDELRPPAMWPRRWIAAVTTVALVAAAVWLIVSLDDRGREPAAGTTSDGAPASTGAPSAVEEYVRFAATAGEPQAGAGAGQLAEGLRKLAGALAALNVGGPDLPIDLRVGAEHILLNPASTAITATVRDDLNAAAHALELATETSTALRGAAESIKPDRPLIEQQSAMLQFFRQAADALQRR
jgi:hypothetical protein